MLCSWLYLPSHRHNVERSVDGIVLCTFECASREQEHAGVVATCTYSVTMWCVRTSGKIRSGLWSRVRSVASMVAT